MNRGSLGGLVRGASSLVILVGFHSQLEAATGDETLREDSAARGGVIETITVTAQRRPETQLEVPLSITALSGTELERQNVSEVADLQRVVPGFSMSFAGAHAQPTIRGVGTQVAGVGLPSNVAIYVDGVYRPNPIMNNVAFEDVASVQVLKGPQGTLYGRNATGGAVLVATRTPSTDAEAEVAVSYRDYGETRTSAFAGGPLSDNLAASLSAFGVRGDGYKENIVPGVPDEKIRNWGARGKLIFWPTSDVTVNLTVEHTDVRDPYTFAFTNYEGISVGSLIPGAVVTSEPRDYSNDYRPTFESERTGAFLTAEFDFDWGSLTSVTSGEWQDNVSEYDVDGSSATIQHVNFPGEQRTYLQSIDLASAQAERFEWVAGVFLYDDKGEQSFSVPAVPAPLELIEGYVETKSVAVYGDVTYHISPTLHLSAGVRYSRDWLDMSFSAPPSGPAVTEDTDFDATTPRVTLRYDLTDYSSAYLSYTEGYKTGGFNPLSATVVPVDPEKIDAYEIGYKASFGVWELQGAAFYYDYSNLQVIAYEGPLTTLVNAAKADISGAELQVAAEPLEGLRVDLGLSYVDSEYESFPAAPHYEWTPGTGIAVFPDDASGNPVVNSPDFSGRLGASYVRSFSNGLLELAANYSYQSRAYFDSFKETEQDAYGVLNLSVGWESTTGRWGVRGFVENATDEDYVKSIFQQPVAFSSNYAPPRTFGVELKFKYGD